jgi:hypothetical protein
VQQGKKGGHVKVKCIINAISIVLILSPMASNAAWKSAVSNDEMTNEKIGTVISSSIKGNNWIGIPYSAVVRCRSSNYSELDIYINWGEFITDHASDYIQFRFDKDKLFKVEANPSTDGSASFVKTSSGVMKIHELMKQKTTMRVRTTDYRGVSTQVGKFSLNGFSSAYNKSCGWWEIKNKQVRALYDGINPEVASAMKRWGPKNIIVNKKILESLGKYSGIINADVTREYVLSVSSVYNKYIDDCEKNKINGLMCTSYRITWKSGNKKLLPPVSSVFYELATGSLKSEAGKLKVGD